MSGTSLPETPFTIVGSAESETHDSGIHETSVRRVTRPPESESGNDDRPPVPSPRADPPTPAGPSEIDLLRQEIAELRAEVRALRNQVRQKSTTEVKGIACETSDSDASTACQKSIAATGTARRRRHRRRRKAPSRPREERPSMAPHYGDSSESEREQLVEVATAEVCVVKAPDDANPRTPEVDPAAGSPSSAASVQSVQRQDATRTGLKNNERQTEANQRTTDGSPPSAVSVREPFKGLVIWNREYRPQQVHYARHGGDRGSGRHPVSDS